MAEKSTAPVVSSASGHAPARRELQDVWSRSGTKYRVRAAVLLLVDILLFSGVGIFAFWIRSGVAFAPSMEGYWDQFALTVRVGGDSGVTLGSMLVEPISVRDVPMQIAVLGLLMASLIAVPILVSILYRFWWSLPFIGVVGFLAVMPWLAVTLTASCVIASVRPFRTRRRFMSALVALLPTVLYLILASAGTARLVAGKIDPLDHMKFVAPWMLAIVAATVVFAISLSIARLVDYRPGAIAPLLAIMFGLPVMLFEFHVGRDELHYRLLERLSATHFEPIDASADLARAVRRAWERHPAPRPKWEQVYQVEEEKWQMALAADLTPFESELSRHKQEVVDRCEAFHRDFPDSRYMPNVLYIKGRALDMRVDVGHFRRTKWIRFYDDVPTEGSRRTWEILAENRPDSVLAAVALLRLARLDAADCRVDRAVDRLETMLGKFGSALRESANWEPAHAESNVLRAQPPEASLNLPLGKAYLGAVWIRDLCTLNRDPLYGYDPLCGRRRAGGGMKPGLLDLDSRSEHYAAELNKLLEDYPNAQLTDNILLEIAKTAAEPKERIANLELLTARFPEGDAMPEALYRLAAAYTAQGNREEGAAAHVQLARRFPESAWATQAARIAPAPVAPRTTGREGVGL